MRVARGASLKLGRADNESEVGGPPFEPAIRCDQATPQELRQRDVLGVIGPHPSELVRERPGDRDQTGMAAHPEWRPLEPL